MCTASRCIYAFCSLVRRSVAVSLHHVTTGVYLVLYSCLLQIWQQGVLRGSTGQITFSFQYGFDNCVRGNCLWFSWFPFAVCVYEMFLLCQCISYLLKCKIFKTSSVFPKEWPFSKKCWENFELLFINECRCSLLILEISACLTYVYVLYVL